jgi:hypothetical protein
MLFAKKTHRAPTQDSSAVKLFAMNPKPVWGPRSSTALSNANQVLMKVSLHVMLHFGLTAAVV